MTKATAGVLSDETLRPHRIVSTTSRCRLRRCVQCNNQYRRLDVHLLITHTMPIDNVGVLLADEKKKRADETTRTRRTEHHDAPPVTTSGRATLGATKGLRIHNTARCFIKSFYTWLQNMNSGVKSQTTALLYATYTARFIEALGGKVVSLKSYAQLCQEDGHLANMRASIRPGTSTSPPGQRVVQLSPFHSLWRQLIPHVVIGKPMSDLCWVCQRNNTHILKAVNM
ncbi:hypothetical protein LSAT2_020151, partial [Lamellibrachia satsuma]